MTRDFKGMCNVCGIIGHKGTDWFDLQIKWQKINIHKGEEWKHDKK
jgi:hypothetical protein